jgi:molybdenum cofactor cytidylyltransferase
VIAGLVLAAGISSRLGRSKQLEPVGGVPLLQHAVDAAATSRLDEMVVVLGARAAEIEAAVRWPPHSRRVLNERFAIGQSTSLLVGLDALGPEVEAAVVLLGDQPGIRPEAIDAVLAAHAEGKGPVVQATYAGRPAHPTLLARSVWPELASLAGDQGARSAIAAHPGWRTTVEVGGEPPPDVDTEEDLARLRAAFERR